MAKKRNRIKAVTVTSEAGCLQSNSNFLLSWCKCSQLCFILFYFPSHFMLFIFISLLSFHPRKRLRGLQKVTQKIGLYMKTRTWTTAQSTCCCCDHLTKWCGCPEGEGGPKWRGDNEELTGLLDCSMSLRSHIFSRRSRSFSSCSLVLRSLSSFLSLSSVASISHLHHTAGENC